MKFKSIGLFGLIFSAIYSFSLVNQPINIESKAEESFPAIGEEYLKNNDFSNDLISFSNVENIVSDNFVNLMVERVTSPSDCHSPGGAVSIQFDSSDNHLNTSDFPAIWQDVPVKRNTYYQYTAFVKRSGDAPNGWLSLGYRNPYGVDKWAAVNQNLYNDTTSSWTQLSLLIYTDQLDLIRCSMHVQCCATGHDGYYLIDDISLKEVDINDYVDTSSTASTNVKIADLSKQYVNDPSLENFATTPMSNCFAKLNSWHSFSWAGSDKSGWGSDGSVTNAFLTTANTGLEIGERPAIGQDILLEKNTYYVVSLYARKWEDNNSSSPLVVALQDSNGVNSGTDNNTAMFKKNLDSVSFDDIGTSYVEKQGVLYTGNYVNNRLVVYTTSVEYQGEINGYHVDNIRLWKVLEPEEAKLKVQSGYKIGQKINSEISVKFKDKVDFVPVYFGQHIKSHFQIEDESVLVGDLANNLVAIKEGRSKIKANLEIFGKNIETNELTLVVSSANANSEKYIKNMEISTNQDISTEEYRTLLIDTYNSENQYISENQLTLNVAADDPRVIYVRLLTTGYSVIGLSSGTTRVYVTAKYENSIFVAYISFTVETDNYLVDPSFEAQNEYSFWEFYGNSGGSGDDSQTNTYRRSGYANIWIMAPVFWDNNVPIDAKATVAQYVDISQGKYDLSCYINRYQAKTSEGTLSSYGGLVTLTAVQVDEIGNQIGEPIYREFDCSYGSFAYGRLSIVFDVINSGRYYVSLHVDGDSQFGLGLQVDDFTLKHAIYPMHIEATLGDDVANLDVESIYNIYVYAVFDDENKVEINTDLRYFFSDFSIACYSNGFLFPRKEGKTTCTIRANYLDKTFETILEIVVGNPKEKATNKAKVNAGLTIGISAGSAMLLGAGVMATIFVIKKKKRAKSL